MSHVALLGDSVFDNARYVPGEPPVAEQLQALLAPGWRATLVAVDGHTVEDVVPSQLPKLPSDASHIVLSIGGNNALGVAWLLPQPASTVESALAILGGQLARFASEYDTMLRALVETRRALCVCTIYDAIPGLGTPERAGLAGFNDVITRAAARYGLALIDLRVVCGESDDFSSLSPIEPSSAGGAKIAAAIARAIAGHDFASGRCRVWV
jgi:hypothetical protein